MHLFLFISVGSGPLQRWDQNHGRCGIRTGKKTWIRSRIFMTFPLNINLIIPFKDNKGERLKLYLGEMESFQGRLNNRVEELKEELVDIFGNTFELTIAARSDGSTKKYYWRFKSSKQDRKYNRLQADSVVEYLSGMVDKRKLRVKEMELELIYINANMKLLKGMKDSIKQSQNESEMLLQANI